MSSDERSPKRQRLSSYSPASTPTETKSTPAPFVQHPNTPPPSVHMSPSWHSQTLPGLGMADKGNGGGVNFPTPPSPAGGYQSQSVGSERGSARQTPAAEGEKPDVEMQEGGNGDGDVSMAEDGEHRRTDHERTADEDAVPPLPSAAVGLFKLPSEPLPLSAPTQHQNLFPLYNLERLKASVARKDPVTGEKINKLRKSYEGKVKDLNLEGRNKSKPNKRELEGFLDPEWDLFAADGRQLWEYDMQERLGCDFSERGAEGMFAMLDGALSFQPGRLPRGEDAQWKSLLGLDDSARAAVVPPAAASAAPAKTAANNFLSKASPATAVQRSAPASPRGATMGRPERSGKKRRYDDASWEGYDEDGYSTGDGGGRRDSASKRQKRKDFPSSASTATSPAYSANNGNTNAAANNMVGVRSS